MFQFSFPILFKWTSRSIKCLITSVKFASRTPSAEVKMVRVLNVAEKNDAAKSLADIMSRGRYSKVIEGSMTVKRQLFTMMQDGIVHKIMFMQNI